MKKLILERTGKINENKSLLEKKLHVKIMIIGRNISISGEELNEFLASTVIEAIKLGFPVEIALMLTEPDFVFEKIEIKNLTKRRNLEEVRARVIGKDGRTKALVEELSECYISVHGNEIGVIGPADTIKNCLQAITKLVQGTKQANVYAYLEKQRKILHPSDLGLKVNEEKE